MGSETAGKICPKCGSNKIKWLHGGSVGGLYRCVECDYQGPIFLVDKDTLPAAIRKRFKKQMAAYSRWDREKKGR